MKRNKTLLSQKKLVKSALSCISLLLLLCSLWIGSDPFLKQASPSATEVPQFFSNQTGDHLENGYSSAIHGAKKSILMMIFSLTNDSVISALRQKSEQGLQVKVICDAKASPHIIQKLGPKVEVVRRFAKGLMHLKILVIDDHECWIGSANMTGESLNMHGNLVVAMKAPNLAEMMIEKSQTLQEYDRIGEVQHRDFLIGGQKVEFSFLPDDRKGCLRIKELIRAAKKTIRVAMFTWTRDDLAKELVLAKKRGVQVEVVLDNTSARGASSKIANLLKKEHISVAFSRGKNNLLHHKFVWIDNNTLELGSANWTQAAFSQNDDCFLIFHDLTQDQQNQMHKLWQTIQSDSISAL